MSVNFSLRNAIYLYLAQLFHTNGKSDHYFSVPLNPELCGILKAAAIDVIFKEGTGVQVKILEGKQAKFMASLLQDKKNLTGKFYQTIQEWYNKSENERFHEEILSSEFEHQPSPSLAQSYRSVHSFSKPDVSLLSKMTGLDNDILNTSPELLKKFNELSSLDIEFDGNYPIRDDKRLSVDLGFCRCAEDVVYEFPHNVNTFYIINTGHSIPVGARLLSSYHIPCTVFMRQVGLSGASLIRVFSQLTAFGQEIKESSATTACASFAWLLDCHVGERYRLDDAMGKRVIDFNKTTYLNRLPKSSDLRDKDVRKVVVMVEYSPQISLEISDLKDTPYANFSYYLEMLVEDGLDVVIRGIDCRKDVDIAT